ncbi:hypothetical protein TNCT_415571 [Trichonephila clavata]|uniref:Uncharacterized protein n=1 Tax=Trichonephila clavata TaxID=2740835 RepID=A0A8X6FHJ2_TRICU|nr:hypothetical protein TNCT_415571 [Trichonephila clavata]
MVKSTKYNFYDDNRKKCIIVNDDFEEEEKDLFDSDWSSSSTNPNFKMESYNDAFHFKPISMDASPVNSKDEYGIIDNPVFEAEGKKLNDTIKSNSASSLSNPNFETKPYKMLFI